MAFSETEAKVREIVTAIVHCDTAGLLPATTWRELKADSIDLVQILVVIEETFGIEIADDDAGRLSSLRELVTYIDERLARQKKRD